MGSRIHYAIFSMILFISSNCACSALDSNETIVTEDREQCFMPTLSCFKKLAQMRPWFDQVEKDISDSPQNKSDLEGLRTKLSNNTKLSLRLGLKVNGTVDRLSTLQSSGLESADKEALNIITQSAPFLKAPNDLVETGVLIEVQFLKIDDNLKVKLYTILPHDFGMQKLIHPNAPVSQSHL